MKWYEKYGRKVNWNVSETIWKIVFHENKLWKYRENMEKKPKLIYSWNDIENMEENLWNDMENMEESQVE